MSVADTRDATSGEVPEFVDEVAEAVGPECCPACGAAWSRHPIVQSAFLGAPLRRCAVCGDRFALDENTAREVVTCEVSGLPFYADRLLPGERPVSPECRTGRMPQTFTDPSVIEATEYEVRRALDGASGGTWSFVTEPKLGEYLDRTLRAVGGKIGTFDRKARVVLVDDARLRSLALPSGTVLISLGLLSFLEDEAELAFVLAHELAHAAAGDAGSRLVWLSMEGLSRDENDAGGPWAAAADELVRLGHGRLRELEADRRALRAVLDLNYDPASIARLFDRLDVRALQGCPRIRELAAAHPPAPDRKRDLERALLDWDHRTADARVNRSVFRKAAGQDVLRSRLEPAPKLASGAAESPEVRRRRWAGRGWLLVVVGVLAVTFVLVGRWLAG